MGNQCAVYVAGQGFLWANMCLSITYALEYVLVLAVCSDALNSAEEGLTDSVAEVEDKSSGKTLHFVLSCLLALALVRFVVATASGRACCQSSKISVSPTTPGADESKMQSSADAKDTSNDAETSSNVSKVSELTGASSSDRSTATVVIAQTNFGPGVMPGQALACD